MPWISIVCSGSVTGMTGNDLALTSDGVKYVCVTTGKYQHWQSVGPNEFKDRIRLLLTYIKRNTCRNTYNNISYNII